MTFRTTGPHSCVINVTLVHRTTRTYRVEVITFDGNTAILSRTDLQLRATSDKQLLRLSK